MKPSMGLRAWTGHDSSWPVFVLLLIVVLVPTVGVLWFMGQAVENEQLAVRQQLRDVYQARLLDYRQQLQHHWQTVSNELGARDGELDPAAAERQFARAIRSDAADSVVVYGRDRILYPEPLWVGELDDPPDRAWLRAERLESTGRYAAASEVYAQIAATSTDPHWTARALLAQARCSVQMEKPKEAIELLVDRLGRPQLATARDAQGRLIAPNARLRALQLMDDATPRAQEIARHLADRVSHYGSPPLPASQRRFLMDRLLERVPGLVFETLNAERLAERYVQSQPPVPSATALLPAGLPGCGIWPLRTAR